LTFAPPTHNIGGSRFIRARRAADSGRSRLDANFAVIFAARAPLIRKSRGNVNRLRLPSRALARDLFDSITRRFDSDGEDMVHRRV
jgi:hypothetical protein